MNTTLDEVREELRIERLVRVNHEQKINQQNEFIRDLHNVIHEKNLQLHALQNAINYIARKVERN